MTTDFTATSGPLGSSVPTRIRLAPESSTTPVDGGWWPHSDVLTAELPGLVDALASRVGKVLLVGYHRAAWSAAPGSIRHSPHVTTLLQPFDAGDIATVIVVGTDGRSVTLTVVPAAATETDAHRALADAASSPEPTSELSNVPSAQPEVETLGDMPERLSRSTGAPEADVAAWAAEAAAQFATVPIKGFVPILVEHIVRNRIAAERNDVTSRPRV